MTRASPVANGSDQAANPHQSAGIGSVKGVCKHTQEKDRQEHHQELNVLLVHSLSTHIGLYLLVTQLEILDQAISGVQIGSLDASLTALDRNGDHVQHRLLDPKCNQDQDGIAILVGNLKGSHYITRRLSLELL